MDLILATREAVVTRMKAFAGLTALIPAGSIYGERVPDTRTFPFIRMGSPDAIPFRVSCYEGEQLSFSVSAFVKGASMDGAAAAGKQIKAALNDSQIDFGNGDAGVAVWVGGEIRPDPAERDIWHSFSSFVIT